MSAINQPTFPQTLGKYRIEGVLGKGAMGIVYKALDTIIERSVALKTIHRNLVEGEGGADWLARFKQEARAAGRCMHPNIVAVFDYGEDQGIPYIAMEYVNGKELSEYLRNKVRFKLSTALFIVTQVLNALNYAHASNIVHRDIKPANIMLLDDGHIKVTDFGIARLDASSMTQHGVVVGTPAYMSPEQFSGTQHVDHRTDLYSTGVVLFELLTGANPYPGKHFTEVMFQIVQGQMRDIRQLNPGVSEALNAVVRRAMAKNPDDRFQSAAEFAHALQQAGTQQAMTDSGETVLKPMPGAAMPATGVWEPTLLRQIEEALSFHMGPVARVLVKNAARDASSMEGLAQTLARHIPTDLERTEFLRRVRKATGGSSGQTTGGRTRTGSGSLASSAGATGQRRGFSEAELATVQGHLITYIGPIAKVLVKRLTREAVSLDDLYRRLAEHIQDPKDQAAFLDKIPPAARR